MKKVIKILIVEDEVLIAMSLKMELEKAKYKVVKPIATGEKAIIIAKQESPDIILMDIRLAGIIDGIEAARQIMTDSNCSVIFMTGYPEKSIEERAMKLNPLAYYTKPVSIHELIPIIDSILQREL